MTDTHVPLEEIDIDSPAIAKQDDSVLSISSTSSSANGVEKDGLAPGATIADTTTSDSSNAPSANGSENAANDQKKDSSDSTMGSTETSAEESRIQKLFHDTLRFVIQSEETQKSAKQCFCKDFDDVDKKNVSDWTENHFMMKDKDDDELRVLLTSYQYGPRARNCGWKHEDDATSSGSNVASGGVGDNTPTHWLKLPCPQDSCKKPEVTNETDNDIRRYLEYIRQMPENQERFTDCEDLNNMIQHLVSADIPTESNGYEKIRAFISSAVEYSNKQSSEVIAPVYKSVHEWLNKANAGASELVAGFGHVRMVYTNKQNPPRIVNGPLFEVPLEAKLQLGASGTPEILIRPTKDAQIALNAEVMSAIIASGGGNSHYVDKLYNLVESTNVTSLRLDTSDSYREFLQTAIMLRCRGEERSANNPDVHVPPRDLEACVVTDAWCLLTRKRASTKFSRDARNLIAAYDQKKLEITEPIRALLSGPEFLTKYIDRSSGTTDKTTQDDQLVYPLPASELQQETCIRLLVDGEPVFIVEGPPGMLREMGV